MNIYKPLQPGIPAQHKQNVSYQEFYPDTKCLAYCFWSLQALEVLKDDFHYLILPDACVDIVFDLSPKPAFQGAFLMTSSTVASTINLGKNFRYAGVRLLPGVWREQPGGIMGQTLELNKLKGWDFSRTRQQLENAEPDQRHALLASLIVELEQLGVIGTATLANLKSFYHTVEDYMQLWSVSRRHTQRLFRRRLGFAPHDFIKIVRFQQSLRQGSFEDYADQAHYIREFKRITDLTPREFQTKYR